MRGATGKLAAPPTPNSIPSWKRQATRVLCVVSGALLAIALVVYLVGVAPSFYHRIDGLSGDDRVSASKQFVRQSASLWNQMVNEPAWRGKFVDSQLNAWLAGDLIEKLPSALPRGVSEPRVAFEDDRFALGFKMKKGPVTCVVSVSGQVWMPEANLIAIELERVRAGVLPLPYGPVVETLSAAAASAGLELQWKQRGGKPVALLSLAKLDRESGIAVERMELNEGVLRIAGRSRGHEPPNQRAAEPPRSGSTGVNLSDQRPDSSVSK